MERLTEEQTIEWYCDACGYKDGCKQENVTCTKLCSFLKIGKEKGYIEMSAVDSYNEYAKREISDMNCIGLLEHANDAIKELQEELKDAINNR